MSLPSSRPARKFGLNQVYPDPSDSRRTTKAKIDVIVVHGLDAQSPVTWFAWNKEDDPDSGNVHWLRDDKMLPSVMPDSRILTYDWNANYDQTASSDIFLGHAETMLDRIYLNRNDTERLECPIIFIASCFGGLLLAKALLRAADIFHPEAWKYGKILHFTVGVAFLGTPFRGSWMSGQRAADLRIDHANETGGEYSRELIQYLKPTSENEPSPLDELVNRFCEMINHKASKFNVVCVYETRDTNFSALRSKLPAGHAEGELDEDGHGIAVPRGSACLTGISHLGLDARHNMLHKFNDPENDGFRRLSQRLKEFAEAADDVLRLKRLSTTARPEAVILKEGNWIQSRIGASDILTAINAAYTSYGWLGGLEPIRFLLSKLSKMVPTFTNSHLIVDSQLCLQPIHAHVLTSDGPREYVIENAEESFGGDPRTQLIGLTLCALAHESNGSTAVSLFMECLAPQLLDGSGEIIGALQRQLMDDSTIQRILNEGASRGFTAEFDKRAETLKLSYADWASPRTTVMQSPTNGWSEIHMVAGLLKWMVQRSSTASAYFTRSGFVARTAAYLKMVGYMIGTIKVWDGQGNKPSSLGQKDVILVLGGSHATDELMFEVEIQNEDPLLFHYTSKIAGSLLYHALGCPNVVLPEILQTDFNQVFAGISNDFQVHWELFSERHSIHESIAARFEYLPKERSNDPIQRSLAAIYFPMNADLVAGYYSRVANETVLRKVQDPSARQRDVLLEGDLAPEIAQFRAVTAAITIALISRMASGEFGRIRHAARLGLEDERWLNIVCKVMDEALSGRIPVGKATWMLAAVHAGEMPKTSTKDNLERVLGWRHGIYAIIPTLFLEMKPIAAAVGLTCVDFFIMNAYVHNDGTIRDAIVAPTFQEQLEFPESTDHTVLGQSNDPWLGAPRCDSPDVPLYFHFERPFHYGQVDTCLAGRINGNRVGAVSIDDVLQTIMRSTREPDSCDHSKPLTVQNVKASRWAKHYRDKPAGTQKHTAYLIVKDSAQWALFLAGQAQGHGGRIVHRCIECALSLAQEQNQNKGVTLIGYFR